MTDAEVDAVAAGGKVPGVPPLPLSLSSSPTERDDEDHAVGGLDDEVDDDARMVVGVIGGRMRDSTPRVGRDPRLMDIVGMDGDVDVATRRPSSPSLLPNLTSMENLAVWNRIHAAARGTSRYISEGDEGGIMRPAGEEGSPSRLSSPEDRASAAIAAPKKITKTTATPPPPPTIVPRTATNANTWLREEEERFLHGLRLYGWGQWKRIQVIVRTRTNKQIKSHAQKRERMNPGIRDKYACSSLGVDGDERGGSMGRKGRLSSRALRALEEDARLIEGMMLFGGDGEGGDADVALDAMRSIMRGGGGKRSADLPSLDQARIDIYGTTDSDGGSVDREGGMRGGYNSMCRKRRRRRRRSVERHPPRCQFQQDEHEQEQMQQQQHRQQQQHPQQHPPQHPRQQQRGFHRLESPNSLPALPPLLTYNQHIKEAASQPIPPRQQHRIVLHSINHSQPIYSGAGRFVTNMPNVLRPPPRPLSVVQHDEPAYTSAAIPVPGGTDFARPTVEMTTPIAVAHAERSPTMSMNLRPGMRVISLRSVYDIQSWYPGVVYSARVDTNKLAHAGGGDTVPLLYHIQFDDGTEDPNVPEAEVLCDTYNPSG